jgi:hypothetical protein
MNKSEIYVEITNEKERLRAIEILEKAWERIYPRCYLKEKNGFGKLTRYHDGEWICSFNLSAKKTKITLNQLEEMLMPKSEMKKQTAVEWFFKLLFEKHGEFTLEEIENGNPKLWEVYLQAKEMDKQQTIDAYLQGCEKGEMFNNENRAFTTDANQYYNETFNNEENSGNTTN